MTLLGLAAPHREDLDAIEENAANLFNNDRKALGLAVERAAFVAAQHVPRLPKGVRWLCEVQKYDERILPARVSRSSGSKGFGGSIDLLSSDKTYLVDLKFVAKIPERIKPAYLWQLASYYILVKPRRSILLFISRDAISVGKWEIDFSIEPWATFISTVKGAIHSIGLESFEMYAVYRDGEHCGLCYHKKSCPLHNMPDMRYEAAVEFQHDPQNFLTDMIRQATASRSIKPVSEDLHSSSEKPLTDPIF